MKREYVVTITRREYAELLEAPTEDAPLRPDEVAGRTVASLISAGTELASAYTGDQFPATSGYAAVFQVEEVGSEAQGLQPGDMALCMGGHRSQQRHRATEVARVPEGVHPRDAVFARLMGVSISTLTTTAARPPGRVVIAGLGLVGHLAAQVFSACGYRVLGCDPDPARRAYAAQKGVAVSPTIPLGDPEWEGQTALVIDCSGHEQAALDGCKLVAKRGEVVLLGTPWRRRTELTAHELLHAIFHRYVVVRSGWEWELPLHPADFRANSIWGNLSAALEWLSTGKVTVDGLFALYTPRECQGAYQALLNNTNPELAVVFDWKAV